MLIRGVLEMPCTSLEVGPRNLCPPEVEDARTVSFAREPSSVQRATRMLFPNSPPYETLLLL